jgi:hypothetical protein
MTYPHRVEVKEIPVPPKTIQVTISTDYETHITKDEFYADPEEFLKFWQPLVEYYEGVKREQNRS